MTHLECGVCTEIMEEPTTLPCGHSFCRTKCLIKWIQNSKCAPKCPECRHDILNTDFNINFALRYAIDLAKSPICSECQNLPSSVYCTDCEVLHCSACSLFIHRPRCLNHHQIVPISQRPSEKKTNQSELQGLIDELQSEINRLHRENSDANSTVYAFDQRIGELELKLSQKSHMLKEKDSEKGAALSHLKSSFDAEIAKFKGQLAAVEKELNIEKKNNNALNFEIKLLTIQNKKLEKQLLEVNKAQNDDVIAHNSPNFDLSFSAKFKYNKIKLANANKKAFFETTDLAKGYILGNCALPSNKISHYQVLFKGLGMVAIGIAPRKSLSANFSRTTREISITSDGDLRNMVGFNCKWNSPSVVNVTVNLIDYKITISSSDGVVSCSAELCGLATDSWFPLFWLDEAGELEICQHS
ncbi:hypothetical protein P9112_012049 [Eukaryota sp. TZLM1-RC]